jgi:hypothetical protein
MGFSNILIFVTMLQNIVTKQFVVDMQGIFKLTLTIGPSYILILHS